MTISGSLHNTKYLRFWGSLIIIYVFLEIVIKKKTGKTLSLISVFTRFASAADVV